MTARAALAVLRTQMSDPTSGRSFDAAAEVLKLESTRMRHGGRLTETADEFDPLGSGEGDPAGLFAAVDPGDPLPG